MNLTKYNPNNDRGITTQPNVSGLRCFDGEDLCKFIQEFSKISLFESHYQLLCEVFWNLIMVDCYFF